MANNSPMTERRGRDRTPDDADWESKVLARVSGHLQDHTNKAAASDDPTLGWESSVLDVLRKRIEQGPK